MKAEDEPGEIYWVMPQPAVRAVQLTDEADWEAIAKWCGGELVGEYDTKLRIERPGLGLPWVGTLNDWVIRGITDEFFICSSGGVRRLVLTRRLT